jgi:hypothetical protein
MAGKKAPWPRSPEAAVPQSQKVRQTDGLTDGDKLIDIYIYISIDLEEDSIYRFRGRLINI